MGLHEGHVLIYFQMILTAYLPQSAVVSLLWMPEGDTEVTNEGSDCAGSKLSSNILIKWK